MRSALICHMASSHTEDTSAPLRPWCTPSAWRTQYFGPRGEIIHEIDLRDGRYVHPETAGIDAILKGWLLARLSDAELEAYGVALFEGLYADLSRRTRRPPPKRQARKG